MLTLEFSVIVARSGQLSPKAVTLFGELSILDGGLV